MFGQLFGKHLVKKGILTHGEYRNAVEKHLGRRVKIGTIAIAEGLLTQEQVIEIHRQQRQYDKLFGDIAVENGFLTQEQVDKMLTKQGSPYLQFLEVLLETGKITISEMEQEFVAFQKENGFSDEDMQALKKDDFERLVPIYAFSSKPYVTDLATLVLRNINRFVTRDFYIGKIEHVGRMDYKCLAGQELVGEHNVALAIMGEAEWDAFLKVASACADENFTKVEEDALDAACEFINCCNGLFVSRMSEKDVDLDMEPVYAFEDQEIYGEVYLVPLYLEGKEIKLVIAVDTEAELGQIPHRFQYEKRESSVAIGLAKGTVVVVDDSKLSRKILRNMLEEAGYAVVAEATDGEEAISAYLQYKPDVITMDITMPNLNGIEAIREILSIDKDAKIVMISAAGQQKKIVEALKIGAQKFITKPFDRAEVISCVESIVKEKFTK